MGYKANANPQPLRQDADEGKTAPKKAMVAVKNTKGPNPDKTAKVLDHTKVGIQGPPKDGEYSKADLDKRLQGHADAFVKGTAAARADKSDGPTTADKYPTKNDITKYGFSKEGSN